MMADARVISAWVFMAVFFLQQCKIAQTSRNAKTMSPALAKLRVDNL